MDRDPTAFEIKFDPQLRRMRGVAVHGSTPFDVPFVSQIAATLWTGGCEEGLQLPEEIVHVVSLYRWEKYRLHDGVRSTLSVLQYDSLDDRNPTELFGIARWVNVCRQSGPTLVHCQAGLNRSARVAALALMLEGMTAKDAITRLREARSPAVLCNPAFEEWLLSLKEVA